MSRAMRRFILWLIVATLPIQGYAAATMVACGPSHERMAAGAMHSHDGDHRSDRSSASHHGGHDHAMADDSARAVSDVGDFSCSACAVCSVGAALPAGDILLDVSAPAPDTLRPSSTTPLTAVTLDGLERPPRSIFA